MSPFRSPVLRAGLAALPLLVAGCSAPGPSAPPAPTSTPGVYQSQTRPGATLDKRAAAEMVSELRRGSRLRPVALDPELNRMAEDQAKAMARTGKLSHSAEGTLKARIAQSGYRNGGIWENIGAGHDTLADAFTGWRSSPPHLKNMLAPKASRMGIAAARAPGSRFEVFWAMVLADPTDPRVEVGAAAASPLPTSHASSASSLRVNGVELPR